MKTPSKLISKMLEFFDDKTMSIHLKENNYPYAKKGSPKKWFFEKIGNNKLTKEKLEELALNLTEFPGLVEIERDSSTIIQKDNVRIVIVRPPFSDGWEITAVRPVKLLELNEYSINEKLKKRIDKKAEGILIAGSPGQGKTTFARALALHFADKGKIVKTIEAPRDLILPDNITQLSLAKGSAEEIQDIILLSRPDYTIFDEMRNTKDFKLFADLRLSGVGMIGIVHATNAIDAIQRFIGRIELGVIPQIIDTVIFIDKGEISKVYEVKMTVKMPSGMFEADLARPVVIVNDFDTKKLVFEIYSYGEDTVVIPVNQNNIMGQDYKFAAKSLEKKIQRYARNAKVEIISGNKYKVYVREEEISNFNRQKILSIEKELGIKIDIENLPRSYETIKYKFVIENRHVLFYPDKEMIGKLLEIYINKEFLMSAKVSKKNIVRISRNSENGKSLVVALNSDKVELRS